MSWPRKYLDLPRIPEPEVMDDSSEVQAYSSAAADAYLSNIDDTFVEHALRLIGPAPGCALDIGCGPGQIVTKLSARLPEWKFIGIDRSLYDDPPRHARRPHSRHSFSRVTPALCPLAIPASIWCCAILCCTTSAILLSLFAEIRRIAKPGAAILLRDLRRPSRFGFPLHVRWYGRHYEGLMYKLYRDSVRAAYTPEELSAMLNAAGISGARLFTHGATHLGIERRAAAAN